MSGSNKENWERRVSTAVTPQTAFNNRIATLAHRVERSERLRLGRLMVWSDLDGWKIIIKLDTGGRTPLTAMTCFLSAWFFFLSSITKQNLLTKGCNLV